MSFKLFPHHYDESHLRAATWDEAWTKGLPRFREEAEAEKIFNADVMSDPASAHLADYWFEQLVPKLEIAKGIYDEEQAKIKDTLETFEKLIAWTKQIALDQTANRLSLLENSDPELIEGLRKNNPEYLTNW